LFKPTIKCIYLIPIKPHSVTSKATPLLAMEKCVPTFHRS